VKRAMTVLTCGRGGGTVHPRRRTADRRLLFITAGLDAVRPALLRLAGAQAAPRPIRFWMLPVQVLASKLHGSRVGSGTSRCGVRGEGP
jgi:hypothetical protein